VDEIRPYREKSLNPSSDQGETNGHERGAPVGDSWHACDLEAALPLLFLLAAEEKAEHIIAKAEAAAVAIEKGALERAAEEGRQEAKQECLPSVIGLANAAQALIVLEEQLISRYTPDIVRLALDIAEKVIGKAVAEDPEIVAGVLDRARREVLHAKQLRIWLNPADLGLIREIRPDLIRSGDEPGRTIEIAASADIDRGGCRVETEMGTIDATIPTQVQELRRQLLDEDLPDLGRAPGESGNELG
jgi:flagellar biosynthesis/type III secretory pathway protein FliH